MYINLIPYFDESQKSKRKSSGISLGYFSIMRIMTYRGPFKISINQFKGKLSFLQKNVLNGSVYVLNGIFLCLKRSFYGHSLSNCVAQQ